MPLPDGFSHGEVLFESGRMRVCRARAGRRSVIVKYVRSPTHAQRIALRQEFEILQLFDSAYVVRPLELIEETNTAGITLHDDEDLVLLAQFPPLDLERWLRVAPELAQAIQTVHGQSVVHRDIKPHNILVSPAMDRVVLLDFGLASRLHSERVVDVSRDGVHGSLRYIAPEQTGRMNRSTDHRSDLYALGATLYHLLSGRPPFVSADPLELVHAHIAKNPPPMGRFVGSVPQPVEAIVARLLAKSPDDRYDSAAGLGADLQRCRDRFDGVDVPRFALGVDDRSEHFLVSERLYGRQRELAELMAGYQRTAAGTMQLCFVTGGSGAGKSRLVEEFQRHLVAGRARFAAGKFTLGVDKEPCSAVLELLRAILEQLSVLSPEQVGVWRNRVLKAAGNNAGLLTELVPNTRWFVGDRPRVPDVDGQEAQARLAAVLGNVLMSLATHDEPLVLLLDDLQWADLPTFALLRFLAGSNPVCPLMLIGTYRDDEVDDTHPIARLRSELRSSTRIDVATLHLKGLTKQDVQDLVRDTLGGEQDHLELAELIYERTNGIGLFVAALLSALHNDGYLERSEGGWTWDIERVRSMPVHETVVDLLLAEFGQLAAKVRRNLAVASCIGSEFDLRSLSALCGTEPGRLHDELWPAIEAGYIVQSGPRRAVGVHIDPVDEDAALMRYRFSHDRVQQAADALLGDDRARIHLELGRRLRADATPDRLAERAQAIASHIDQALELLTATERVEYARINWLAGVKAKQATAFGAATNFFRAARELLGPSCWSREHTLTYETCAELADCLYLRGSSDEAHAVIDEVLTYCKDPLQRAQVLRTKAVALTNLGRFSEALGVLDEALSRLGVHWPRRPSPLTVLRSFTATKLALLGKTESELVSLPMLKDPKARIVERLLFAVLSPSYQIGDKYRMSLATFEMIRVALRSGLTPTSGTAFTAFGLLHCVGLQDFELADLYARVGVKICGRDSSALCQALFMKGASITHWIDGTSRWIREIRMGYDHGIEAGELLYAGYCGFSYVVQAAWSDVHLSTVIERAEIAGTLLRQTGDSFVFANDIVGQTARMLHDPELELHPDALGVPPDGVSETGLLGISAATFQLGYLLGEPTLARRGFEGVRRHRAGGVGTFTWRGCIVLNALYCSEEYAGGRDRVRSTAVVLASLGTLRRWASKCAVHLPYLQLAQGAWALARGKINRAITLLGMAIEGVSDAPFVRGIAEELVARAFLRNGNSALAAAVLARASATFEGWGALAKVVQLNDRYPNLAPAGGATRPEFLASRTTLETSALLDLTTVVRAGQILSQEIVTDALLERLVRVVLENAGGQHAAVWTYRGAAWKLRGYGELDHGEVRVVVDPVERLAVPVAARSYVERNRTVLLIADAQQVAPWCRDPTVVSEGIRSIMCVPVMRNHVLQAVVYVDHREVSNCFTPERALLLQTLGVQISISLENARLYEGLEEEVAERTEALRQATRNRQDIVDNVAFGFLTVGADLAIREGWTRSCEELLGKPVTRGACLLDSLDLHEDRQRTTFQTCTEQFFADWLPEDVLTTQFPSRVICAGRILRLEPKPIRDETGQVCTVLFSITDTTALENARLESHANRVLLEQLDKKAAFVAFVNETREQLTAALECIRSGDQASTRHIVHTLKGNARCFGLDGLSSRVHAEEERPAIDEAGVARIDSELQTYLRENFAVLHIPPDDVVLPEVTIDAEQFDELERLVAQACDPARGLARWVSLARSPTVGDLTGPLQLMLVRICHELGKNVEFAFEGSRTKVTDPRYIPILRRLVHLVTNSVDHGIEFPQERGSKPLIGKIDLRVGISDDGLTVAVEDDGRGIDVEQICAVAIERGIVDEQRVRNMDEQAKLQLIFLDGLSTAPDTSTALSGRGVGVSALKGDVDSLGGRISVRTTLGRGTTVELVVPSVADIGSRSSEERKTGT